jgi:manganese/zinc/iron transport system permease protein
MPSFFSLSEGYAMLVVASGAGFLGAISGLVGTLAILKKQSLLADAVSHASLPGIVLAFILAGSKTHPVLLAGALVAGCAAAVQMLLLVSRAKLRQDSSMSLLLSVYFGFGMVLLSFIQHKPGAAQAGIETFLFGEAATMLIGDVYLVACIGLVILYIFALFSKELFLVALDPGYAEGAGFSVFRMDVLFVILVVANVVAGLQMVGVVLMSAMIVAPAAAARQWSNNLRVIISLSCLFGISSGISGSLLSSYVPNLPTGPAIIVFISLIALFSFFFAYRRGIIWEHLRKKKRAGAADYRVALKTLYMLSLQHTDVLYGHPVSVVLALCPKGEALLDELEFKGLAVRTAKDLWSITPEGKQFVEEVLK